MDLRTTIAYNILKDRLKTIERYTQHADEIQQRQLLELLRKASYTEWGNKHGYKYIRHYEEYKNLFPVRNYDEIKDDVM